MRTENVPRQGSCLVPGANTNMTIDNLDRIGSLMRDLGHGNVRVNLEHFCHREVPIVHIGKHFFPGWELDDADNLALFTNGMFLEIEAKRPANWQPVEHLSGENRPIAEWEAC